MSVKIAKQGNLQRKGMFGYYSTKYFILYSNDTLSYFDSQESLHAVETIDLADPTSFVKIIDERVFEIHSKTSSIAIMAANGMEASSWCSALSPDKALWMPSAECYICHSEFGVLNFKHHCRNCGWAYCKQHCSTMAILPRFGKEPQRLCTNCVVINRDRLNRTEAKGDPSSCSKCKAAFGFLSASAGICCICRGYFCTEPSCTILAPLPKEFDNADSDSPKINNGGQTDPQRICCDCFSIKIIARKT